MALAQPLFQDRPLVKVTASSLPPHVDPEHEVHSKVVMLAVWEFSRVQASLQMGALFVPQLLSP